jgi:hypothetical protein
MAAAAHSFISCVNLLCHSKALSWSDRVGKGNKKEITKKKIGGGGSERRGYHYYLVAGWLAGWLCRFLLSLFGKENKSCITIYSACLLRDLSYIV